MPFLADESDDLLPPSRTKVRTLLRERRRDLPLEKRFFSVFDGRLPGYKGPEIDRIQIKILDGHYLITNVEIGKGSKTALGIVDRREPEQAEERMYQEALKIARARAEYGGNQVLDLTSKAKNTPENADQYVSV